jgi:hypothetical protein
LRPDCNDSSVLTVEAEGVFNYISDVSYDTVTCRVDVCGGSYVLM